MDNDLEKRFRELENKYSELTLKMELLRVELGHTTEAVNKLNRILGRFLWIIGGGFVSSFVAWVVGGGLVK